MEGSPVRAAVLHLFLLSSVVYLINGEDVTDADKAAASTMAELFHRLAASIYGTVHARKCFADSKTLRCVLSH